MRILIDECIDERFRNYLPGHECQTTRYAGVAALKQGELLLAAETARFDVFITADQGIRYQQDVTARNIAVIVLRAIEPVRRSLAAPAGKITRDPDEAF